MHKRLERRIAGESADLYDMISNATRVSFQKKRATTYKQEKSRVEDKEEKKLEFLRRKDAPTRIQTLLSQCSTSSTPALTVLAHASSSSLHRALHTAAAAAVALESDRFVRKEGEERRTFPQGRASKRCKFNCAKGS